MKKFIKKLLACAVMGFSLFMFTACGEVKVTLYYGDSNKEIKVAKDGKQEIINEIKALAQDGYEIKAIYFDKEFSNKWNQEDEIGRNRNLYIEWQGINYNVKFDSNYATSGEMADQVVRYSESVQALTTNAYQKLGYTFAGWATSRERADAGTVDYADGATFTMTAINGVTLYAVWQANPYNVVYNANGGNGEMANQVINFDATSALTTNAFTKPGYTFTGWNTSADGSGYAYSDCHSFTMINEGVTLYAQWAANTYNVVFNSNGGNSGETMANLEIVFDSSKLLSTNTFTRTGYYFTGWNTSADGSGVSYANNAQFEMNVVGGVTLYAQWAIESYNLTIFDGTTQLYTLPGVTYGTTLEDYEGADFTDLETLISQKREEGYAFGGFFVEGDTNFTTRYNFNTPMADIGSNNLTVNLIVRWATLQGSIALNYDGATGGNEVASITANFDTVIGTLPTPTKENHTFIGWYTNTTTFTTETKVTSETVWEDNFTRIYAKFISNSQPFTITYDTQGGTFASPSVSTYYVTSEVELVAPSKNGYNFVSFTLGEVAIINGVEVPAGTLLPKNSNEKFIIPAGTFGVINLVANYQVADYTITVNYADGSVDGTQTSTYTIENDAVLADAVKPGYTFTGYTLTASAVIGGQTQAAGYKLPTNQAGKYYIPAGSYGNLSLTANYAVENYTIEYQLGTNGNFVSIKPSEEYTILTSINIPAVIRSGYDFLGFALGNDAVIGGELVQAGTMLAKEGDFYVIPTGSYGNLTIVAQYQIQTHSVTFKLTPEDETSLLVLTGNFDSEISTLTGYDYDLIMTNMAKAGFAFDGWYTNLNNINPSTKFDFKISYQDIVVYPHYIEKLDAPTNISIGQESSIITWDAVDGADYYLVRIDEGEETIAYYNQFETGLILSAADTYLIEVKAVSTYIGALEETINSDYTEYTFTRNQTLQNSLISVRNQDDSLKKYVMFTGNTYNWTSANYVVNIENLSAEGIATVSQTEEDEVSVKSTITTSKPGTFTIVINYNDPNRDDAKYDVQIVENVSSLSYGEAYTQYLTNTDEDKTIYLDTNFEPYYAGTQNGFAVDFVLSDPNGDAFLEYDITNEELISYSFEVYNESTKEFAPATQSEIPVRLTAEHIAAGKVMVGENEVTLSSFDKAGMLMFDSANNGKKYKITVTLTYSRNITSTNKFGTVSTDFVVTLNNAMNAHSHEELKAYYADKDVHEINVLRNITFVALTSDNESDIPTTGATLSMDQVQPDGSPIATTSKYVYDSDSTTSNGGSAVYKTDGNIYKRAFGLDSEGYNGVGDNIKVNGNYCTIDVSAINPVNKIYSINDTSGPNPNAYNQVGLMWAKTTNSDLIRPHVGVFRYQVPQGDGASFNNLEIIGNKPIGKVTNTDANFEERILRDSASYCGFYVETSKVTLNNVVMSRLHDGVRMDGDLVNWGMQEDTFVVTTPNNGEIETNYTKITDVYGHALYSWQGKEIRTYNSYFGYCGGPAILFTDEGTAQYPTIVIDKHTVFDNYLTGLEAWFVVYNQTSLAQQLKIALQDALVPMGASILKVIDGIEYTNFSLVYMPCSVVDSDKYLEDGTYVDGVDLPRISKCTVYIGGEKTVIDGKNRSTGVKTERGGIEYLTSGDPRIVGGMHAFGATPAVSATEFNFASLAIQTLLTNKNLQGCAIQYALAKEIATVTYNSNKETYDAQGVTIDMIAAQFKATHYANAIKVIETANSIPTGYFTLSEEIFGAIANNFAEYVVLRDYMTSDMKVYNDTTGDYVMVEGNKVYDAAIIQAYVNGWRDALYGGIAYSFAKSLGQPEQAVLTSIQLKYSYEFFYELCKINGKDRLVTKTTIMSKIIAASGNEVAAGTALVQFLLLKMCDAENMDAQFIELQAPTPEQGMMSAYLIFGFQDEDDWKTTGSTASQG